MKTRFLHGPAVDQVFASEDALGKILWALPDNQGTVRDVAEYDSGTDTTSVVNHIKYDSFGIITSESDPSVDFMYSYTGRVWDADAELYYYRNRWYDAPVGRFLSEDPLGFAAGDTNLSRYVFNSPTNFTDPSGQSIGDWWREIRRSWNHSRQVAREQGYSNLWTQYYGEMIRQRVGVERLIERDGLADDLLIATEVVTEYTSWVDPTPTSDGILLVVYVINGQRQEAAFQFAAMAAPGAADKFVKNFPWQKFAGNPGALADALGLPNDDMIRAWAKKNRRQGRLVDDPNWRKELENHHNLVKKHKKKFEQAGFDIEVTV